LRAGGNDIDKALPTFLTHVKNNPTLLSACVEEYLIETAEYVRGGQERAARAASEII
jgi:hypothetical protein